MKFSTKLKHRKNGGKSGNAKNQLRSVRIQLPEAEYRVLEDLAEKQTKTTPQLIQALLDSILEQPGLSLETATPSAMCRFSRLNGSSNDMRTVSSFPPVCSSLR